MKIELEAPDYSPEQGFRFEWEDEFEIGVQVQHGEVVITANRAGLISLARHLLVLAQSTVPPDYHFHLDDSAGLEEGSSALVIAKLADN